MLTGETCARRLAPGTTFVACPKINPARASFDSLPRDMRRRIPTIRCLGYAASLWRDGTRYLPDSNLPQSYRYPDVVFPGDASMGYQFGRASLASPSTPDFGTGAALARPLLQAPAMHAWRDAKPFFDRLPGFRTCLPSGVGNLSGWRETSLVLRSFSPQLEATYRRSWLYKMAAPPG